VIKQLKKFTVQTIAGANVASVIVMLLVGYSDRLNPSDHPLLSTLGMTFPVFLLINLAFLLFWLIFKWRMAWIPVCGFLLTYVPISIYMPINARQDIPEGTLKVISYNVCAYGGNFKYEDGFEHVRDYLFNEAPDIVCLQEDIDTWRRYVFLHYEKHFAYNDTMVIANNAKSFNALGIHTKYPIIRRERINYNSEANGSAAWWLKVGNDTLVVVNNHFESCHLNKDDRQQYRQILKGEMPRDSIREESKLLLVKLAEANAKRAGQIRAVRRYAQEHSQYPVIVCGDFNDSPISYSRQAMAEVMTDCFVKTGKGIGLSYNQKAFSLRIDHFFCNEKLEPYHCKIDDEMDASDHNPLICWLKIKPKH
jgi:endonuclease/exonuclease/phosphatase (EEP) superfamily protein YafD